MRHSMPYIMAHIMPYIMAQNIFSNIFGVYSQTQPSSRDTPYITFGDKTTELRPQILLNPAKYKMNSKCHCWIQQ